MKARMFAVFVLVVALGIALTAAVAGSNAGYPPDVTTALSFRLHLPVVMRNYPPPVTTRVSIASNGAQGNEASYFPSISGDGRYMAFQSNASNLVSGDSNGVADIFVHDRQTGQTTRVSVASDGSQANGASSSSSISTDGRYIAFKSNASNLVSGDSNGVADIFVHDPQTGQTTRVSVASDGSQANGIGSFSPSISPDGRYVAFQATASNFDPTDSWGNDIYVHDRQTGQTEWISIGLSGSHGDDFSYESSISGDGRYVAFTSYASNLVIGDTNNQGDVFVHDRQTGITERVSIASDGTQANGGSAYWKVRISDDGRYVVFHSYATNLVVADTNDQGDVFVHDRQTGITERVSVASDGTQGNGNSGYWGKSISADGHYVAFMSAASNLVAGDANAVPDVFLHDRLTGQTTRVSLAYDNSEANGSSEWPSISADGCYVVFESAASNLVTGDTNSASDIFVRNLCSVW